jgi:hypothetical protein
MFILYFISLCISIALGTALYKRLSLVFRLMLLMLAATLITEYLTHFSGLCDPKWIYSIYAVFSALVYAIIFRIFLSKTYHKIWNVGIIAMSTFFIYEISRLHTVQVFPSELVTFSYPILIIFSIALFHQIIQTDIDKKLRNRPEFLFNAAFILYHSVNFVHLAFYEYLIQSHISKIWSQNIHTITSILYYLFYSIIFMKSKKELTHEHRRI